MANQEKKTNSNPGAIYVVAGIMFAAVLIICMALFIFIDTKKTEGQTNGKASSNAIYGIEQQLVIINRNVLQIIFDVGDQESLIGEIQMSFSQIDKNMAIYEETNYYSAQEFKRYEQAKNYINALRGKLNEYVGQLAAMSEEEAKNVYLQEIATYQNAALQLFDASMDNSKKFSESQNERAAKVSKMVIIVMGTFLVVGEIAIVIAARIAKKARDEAERQERQAEAADRRFKSSQEKISDIAFTNILTDMKNRYALENDIGNRLDSEDFNIAVFDMDNFRSINDIYGYDFGDEYLVQISERLKTEFGEYADFYNITGNEFCAVFKREVSDVQAMRLADNILQAMSGVYNVANIGIQLTASGSTYHCLHGECMNLSALLVKMDNVLRNAKRNGGNTIMSVVGI